MPPGNPPPTAQAWTYLPESFHFKGQLPAEKEEVDMVKRLALALTLVLVLASVALAADGKPELLDAGIYQVTYEKGPSGLTIKTLSLEQAGDSVTARTGISFGVRCENPQLGDVLLQAGYQCPEVSSSKETFWGVDQLMRAEGEKPCRFYGFVFEPGHGPVPGSYAVNLYRADDGSLVARQTFKVTTASGSEAPKPQDLTKGGTK
jgi:hypothetical protein